MISRVFVSSKSPIVRPRSTGPPMRISRAASPLADWRADSRQASRASSVGTMLRAALPDVSESAMSARMAKPEERVSTGDRNDGRGRTVTFDLRGGQDSHSQEEEGRTSKKTISWGFAARKDRTSTRNISYWTPGTIACWCRSDCVTELSVGRRTETSKGLHHVRRRRRQRASI